MKIGIIREGKIPPDKRVALTPEECKSLLNQNEDLEIISQPSPIRCFKDEEYKAAGVSINEDLSEADILLGIKEVPVDMLIPEKKYFFFSHTIKEQPHNKKLMRALLDKKIELIDYECLTDPEGNRIIGFGRYAGIIGAYNGILGYGKKYDLFHLKEANECEDEREMNREMEKVKLPNIKILVTGGGRAANGAVETLGALKIKRITPYEFLFCSFREPVYCQLRSKDYHEATDGSSWNADDFYTHPERYVSKFLPYTKKCDLLISCQYWDKRVPVLFTKNDMKAPDFRISVIADVSCDINGAVPATIRASEIGDAYFGYNPITEQEGPSFDNQTITMMAVDNLPCELPRDASSDFAKEFVERIFPLLGGNDPSNVMDRGTICRGGELTGYYSYLESYANS